MRQSGEGRAGSRWTGAAILVAAAIGLTMLGGRLAGAAPGDNVDPDQGDRYLAADLANQNRFTGQGEVWPPRPDGAGEPRTVPTLEPRYDRDRLVAGIVTDDRVSPLLGDRWDVLAVGTSGENEKRSARATARGQSRITFFSRSTNQSVIVDVMGGRITTINTLAPTVEQLPLNPAEKADAVAIARKYWLEQGVTSVNNLQGFAIQAYEPGGSLYNTRMAYVSFHVDADSRPELLAWVDLTKEVVASAREDR